MIEVERVGEGRDCKHCSRTYGTLGCCSTVSNKWVYSCEEGHREYEKTHKHMTIPEAIEALEQQPCEDCISRNDKRTIHTDGLEEGIRCAMCTNPMANDRGCDGGCIVNESMYQNVLNVIKKQILEQEPCEDCVSRQAILDIIMPYCQDDDGSVENTGDLRNALDDIESLSPVTPKEKTATWVPTDEEPHEDYECNKCGYAVSTFTANIEPHTEYKYCPNCGARMVSE